MFDIETEDHDHYSIIRLSGEIGLGDAVAFTRQIQAIVARHDVPQYLLDLDRITHMDNAGLGVLVSFSTQLQGHGRRFVLLRPNARVVQLLTNAQIESFFPTCDSEAELKRFGKNRQY